MPRPYQPRSPMTENVTSLERYFGAIQTASA